MKNIILNSTDISNKIRRIAFEIIENNIDEKKNIYDWVASKW